ncbi:MAG: CPBP family intramembrane glutamic endopeptidase [Planctomycetota bacterium]
MSCDVHANGQDGPRTGAAATGSRPAEFVVLFFAVPLLLAYRAIRAPIIPFLIAVALVCFVVLMCDRSLPRRRLWDASRFFPRLARVLALFVVAGGIMTGAVAWLLPAHFLSLVRQRPALWQLIMMLYPLLSVYPQEVIYRGFLFHRYRALFPKPWMMVCASAVTFGFVHIIFWNWLAVGLSLLGGFVFARTYQRTGSLLMTSIEHSLYGCLIFTVGLGKYFIPGILRTAGGLAG